MGAAGSRQARLGAVASTERTSLTCADTPEQALVLLRALFGNKSAVKPSGNSS